MQYDVVVIGGGIVGTATALKLLEARPLRLLLIEAEDKLARHQTGNNSGVIHSGLYYRPGSLKARNCVTGRDMMYAFCRKHDIPHEQTGKIVLAVSKEQLPALEKIERRGYENGLTGIIRLRGKEIEQYEPHARGVEALYVPQSGIVDFSLVVEKFAELIRSSGGEIATGRRFERLLSNKKHIAIATSGGEVQTKLLINCAGLYSDRVARACGVRPELLITPFRGEYYKLRPESEHLVNNLIYPVPDMRFPFLGVHFTRMAKGGVEAGPNAVPAFKREGYAYTALSLRDMVEMLSWPGYWKMGMKYFSMGMGEIYRSLHKGAFTRALQRLAPEITTTDLIKGGAGVRAQALGKDGRLIDDFVIREHTRMIHVLNAPSPAATSSLSIGETIAQRALKQLA